MYFLTVHNCCLTVFNFILQNHEKYAGSTFQLVGPSEYTQKEIVEFVSDVTTVKKPLLDVPISVALMAGSFFEQTVSPFLTKDSIYQYLEDNIAKDDAGLLGLSDLGIEASNMDKVAFDYLHRFRPGGHFTFVKGYY